VKASKRILGDYSEGHPRRSLNSMV